MEISDGYVLELKNNFDWDNDRFNQKVLNSSSATVPII